MAFNKYTELYYAKIKSWVPRHYFERDTEGNLAAYLLVVAEMYAGMRLSMEDVYAASDSFKARNESLETVAENFGLTFDKNFISKQRLFIQMAAKWIDRKGTRKAFQTLIASYGLDSDVHELMHYMPRSGDKGLICGMTPEMKCGTGTIVPDGHELAVYSKMSHSLSAKIQDYDAGNTVLNESLRQALEQLTPIHIKLEAFSSLT